MAFADNNEPTNLENIPLRGEAEGAADDRLEDVDEAAQEQLLATLKKRLSPFTATAARDKHFAGSREKAHDHRFAMIARYRDGQRRVLEDAVSALEHERRRRLAA